MENTFDGGILGKGGYNCPKLSWNLYWILELSAWSEAPFNMTTLPETRDLAQQLLAYESDGGDTSGPAGSATLRVYEKLRGNLRVLVGLAGFQALASRALTLARSQVPGLSAVQVAADGKLQGITEIEPPMKAGENGIDEDGVVLISNLLGLLFMFLGPTLTMNLVLNMWPDEAFEVGNPKNGRKA